MDMTPVLDAEALGVDALFEVAVAAGPDPDAAQLAAVGAALDAVAGRIDLGEARRAATEEEPRALVARHPDGPILILRWYVPGEVSTVHRHAWTVLRGLWGSSTVEHWTVRDGQPERERSDVLGPGDIGCLREDEAHRQRAGDAGGLELALLGHYAPDRPRVDLDVPGATHL